MNIKENIRKVLIEEVNKQILTKIVRRLDNIDKLIFQSAEWTSQYYKEKFLKEKGLDWFIETVIDGFYIDYISPIFENWDDDGQLEPVMSISDDEEEELRTFFEDKYYDKIEEYYENIFGNNIDESIIKEDEIKSLFRPITKLIEYFLSKDNVEKYVCDYKLELGNFATKNTGEKYQKFKITLYFKNLPKKNISWNSFTNPNFVGEKIMNELQDLILNAVGVYVDMYGSTSKNCKKIDESIIMEQNIPSTSTELIKNLPEELKKLFFSQWKAKQNPKWHPEGNTLKHIIVVLNRAYANYPDDPNMIMAALFHDLGKSDTYKINPKTGEPTAYGHEDVSTKYVEKFKDWIESFNGTDVDEIKYLVKNHMKVKSSTWDAMRDTKKEPIQKHPAFDKLMGFTDKLDGGGTEIRKSIKEAIKEVVNEMEVPAFIRRRINMTEQDIVNFLRRFAINNYNSNTKIEVSVNKACKSTAYEILDSTHTSIDSNTFQILEYELIEYLKNKYGEQTKDFIENFYNPSGDDNGTTYMFRKHSEKDGNSGMGRGFSQHFDSWNELLMSYASWFPSLDWADVKEKLDSMPDRKQLLIAEPGDRFNTMSGYYFSLVKIKKDGNLNESTDDEYAVIEITKPMSRMPQKWYFQVVPINKTQHDKIYIKRGPAGILTISTKNIKIHKTFKNSEKEEMDKYLDKLRDEDKKKGEQKEGEITERCWKGYTQKGMKTMFGKRYPNCVKKTK